MVQRLHFFGESNRWEFDESSVGKFDESLHAVPRYVPDPKRYSKCSIQWSYGVQTGRFKKDYVLTESGFLLN